jgi:hypothetical protein
MYQQLDETTAYFKGRPIRNSDELSSPLITSPVDPEWNDRIKSNWWHHSNKTPPRLAPGVKFDDRLFELRDKLLSFGGSEVCLPVTEQDLSQILERGQLWHGDRVRFMRGQPSQCHRNSSYCWHANKDITTICTGYALSEDGLWRQRASRS